MKSRATPATANLLIRSGRRCPTSPTRISPRSAGTIAIAALRRLRLRPKPPTGGDDGDSHEHAPVHRKNIFARAVDFLRASWAELKRVQWPDRRQVGQGTAVTIGFVIVAGAYLGVLDAIWNPLIQAIL